MILEVCFGSWKVYLRPSPNFLAKSERFFCKIPRNTSFVMIGLGLVTLMTLKLPTSGKAIEPLAITPPFPSFTVEFKFFNFRVSPFFLHTRSRPSNPKILNFYSSDHWTLLQMGPGLSTWPRANFNRFF